MKPVRAPHGPSQGAAGQPRTEIRGIYPILATPFQATGELDEASLERVIEFLVNAGVPGLTLFGLASETYKLSDEERRRIQRVVLARTHGRMTRIVSITDHSTELARQRAQEAAEAGADALLIMPPFFLAPEPAAVRTHIAEIARAVQLPLLVQYSPNQTGLRLSAKFFVELADEFPPLGFVKVDSTPAGPMITALVKESNGRLQPVVGYAGVQMVDAFTRGAVGCMPGCSLPEAYLEIDRVFRQGDRMQAAALHARLLPLLNFMMQALEFVIQCEKTILYWRGVIACDTCRRPGVQLTREDLCTLQELLETSASQVAEKCVRISKRSRTGGSVSG